MQPMHHPSSWVHDTDLLRCEWSNLSAWRGALRSWPRQRRTTAFKRQTQRSRDRKLGRSFALRRWHTTTSPLSPLRRCGVVQNVLGWGLCFLLKLATGMLLQCTLSDSSCVRPTFHSPFVPTGTSIQAWRLPRKRVPMSLRSGGDERQWQ